MIRGETTAVFLPQFSTSSSSGSSSGSSSMHCCCSSSSSSPSSSSLLFSFPESTFFSLSLRFCSFTSFFPFWSFLYTEEDKPMRCFMRLTKVFTPPKKHKFHFILLGFYGTDKWKENKLRL
ncbi:hypothetical protein AMECASPLE_005311 [Ameca splendens]|uniref:Uncharacterized protein n=1 Tax=Ameca splendens TaxID=208324 RepID=A0ABV0YA22_9TELE